VRVRLLDFQGLFLIRGLSGFILASATGYNTHGRAYLLRTCADAPRHVRMQTKHSWSSDKTTNYSTHTSSLPGSPPPSNRFRQASVKQIMSTAAPAAPRPQTEFERQREELVRGIALVSTPRSRSLLIPSFPPEAKRNKKKRTDRLGDSREWRMSSRISTG
jgi:hypothetical protein